MSFPMKPPKSQKGGGGMGKATLNHHSETRHSTPCGAHTFLCTKSWVRALGLEPHGHYRESTMEWCCGFSLPTANSPLTPKAKGERLGKGRLLGGMPYL